jgi:hypothetical protein
MDLNYTKPSDEHTITFRYVEIPHDQSVIGGIGLWYATEEDAKASFSHFHNYITTPHNLIRRCDIVFQKDSTSTHCLTIKILYVSTEYVVSLTHIDSQYVDRLCESLTHWPQFFIIGGYTDSDGQQAMLPVNEYSFFATAVVVDGKKIYGNPEAGWPYDLFQSGPSYVIEDPGDSEVTQ